LEATGCMHLSKHIVHKNALSTPFLPDTMAASIPP
jgi:hypothetical protein